ncbi:MAG: hypothetical protein IKK10_03195 [Clostridia bacterium]|nr:hypothetical protein [Clostridia bacterium]
MENIFITITGINHYFGKKPFEIGRTVKLIKEPDNPYDNEAIGVYLPFIDKIGNVANSVNTVYGGTQSSGRIWDKIGDDALAEVMFVTHSSVIALVLPPDREKDNTSPASDNNEPVKTETLTPPTPKAPLSKIGF